MWAAKESDSGEHLKKKKKKKKEKKRKKDIYISVMSWQITDSLGHH